jgi:hypothetical protein
VEDGGQWPAYNLCFIDVRLPLEQGEEPSRNRALLRPLAENTQNDPRSKRLLQQHNNLARKHKLFCFNLVHRASDNPREAAIAINYLMMMMMTRMTMLTMMMMTMMSKRAVS